MVVSNTKIFQKMKKKSLLSIEKNIIKWEKAPYYNYKTLFSFKKSKIIFLKNDEAINLLQKADLSTKSWKFKNFANLN